MKHHVIAADWIDETLVIQTRDERLVARQLAWDGHVDWRIEEGRRCVGFWGQDGLMPCPWRRETQHESQCRACAPVWSDCVFEPPADHAGCRLCQQEHLVYLAFHGTLPKVGMTTARRVRTRLREQGADGWIVLQRRRDRHAARRTEQTIAQLTGVPEYRTHRQTLPLLTRPVPWSDIEVKAASWAQKLQDRFDVEPALERIEHPLPVLPRPVARVPVVGRHKGTVCGARGGHMVYESTASAVLPTGERPLLALARSDLAGRTIQVS